MAEPSVLFVDQSHALGGAELCLLDYLRSRSGASRAVVFSDGPFAEALRGCGIATEIIQFEPGVAKSAGILPLLGAVPATCTAAWRLAEIARRTSIVYANTQKAAVVAALAAWWARKPFVWHLHDLLDADHFSSGNRIAVVSITNRVRGRVIANSQATADAYRRAGGRLKTTVVYNGLDGSLFDRVGHADAASLRNELGITNGTPIVGLFGRITPWKGHHVLLEALRDKKLADVSAILVGDALYTEDDQAYAEAMKRKCREEGLEKRVMWLGQRSDVPRLMKACDIVAHCSTQPEPFGRVIAEGMLADRPVVASAAGGALEIVDDGVNGLLTPRGDVRSLVAALSSLIADPTLARRLAEAGLESARRRFRLEDKVREIDELLARVAG